MGFIETLQILANLLCLCVCLFDTIVGYMLRMKNVQQLFDLIVKVNVMCINE